jgi:hypothetical protein
MDYATRWGYIFTLWYKIVLNKQKDKILKKRKTQQNYEMGLSIFG